MDKLTKKGMKLVSFFRDYYALSDDEKKALILLESGRQPNHGYYGESIKALKKKGLIE